MKKRPSIINYLLFCLSLHILSSQLLGDSKALFRAGAVAVDVTPKGVTPERPSIIAGGFLEAASSQINDHLFVRSIVLDDGATVISLTVVDTCMMAQDLIDKAKELASQQCKIPMDRMMVSATHTHSAPAAMGCLGTRQDKGYAEWLPGKIAESIVAAHAKLEPARIGWSSVDDWKHTHNRRWIRQPEKMVVDPFGVANGRAHMHPGYLSPDVIGPSGPVDPALTVLSVQTQAGKPMAVLANYSQHYFGANAISSDYYGLFCKFMARSLGEPGDGNGPFVCAMSQGTSGDLMWMDYGSPAKSITLERYAEEVALVAEEAMAKIDYQDHAPIKMVEKQLELPYRVPNESRLKWARPIAAAIENDKPKSIPEVYAREALILHERQRTKLKVQAIRIGNFTIATLPNEVYALTGLKLRGQTPASTHMNIELANGAEGYIPTPEQHKLGGYTTWPARTAGLEEGAEPKIAETLVKALEEVTGQKRRAMVDEHGPYAKAILDAKPQGYWRLNDADGQVARNAVEGNAPANLSPGFAWFLPGVGSGTGIGAKEALTPSSFSGPTQINRALHLAGGHLTLPVHSPKRKEGELGQAYSLALWVWLGEKSGASERAGVLSIGPSERKLNIRQFKDHSFQLESPGSLDDKSDFNVSQEKWNAEDWNFVVIIQDDKQLRVHVNGSQAPSLIVPAHKRNTNVFDLGVGLEAKLDEIALFDRVLTPEEIEAFWNLSGIADERAREQAELQQRTADALQRSHPPKFPANYFDEIALRKPARLYADLQHRNGIRHVRVDFASPKTNSREQNRLSDKLPSLQKPYSVAMWVRNELPNQARPVTAYLFSRGPDGDPLAPGDHLGIGGTYRPDLTGKVIVFNGNQRDQVVVGRSTVPPDTWNDIVMVRTEGHVKIFLNGEDQPEIDADLEWTAKESDEFFWGERSDRFAPLEGSLSCMLMFDRALTDQEAKELHQLSGQPVGTPKQAPAATPKPTSQPLSPTQSLAKIHVPNGYRVELAASEPLLVDPVAFDWDGQGRLWVVEMSDYPMGMDGQGKAGGRVRVLTDKNQDGKYDESKIFADELNFPNGILTWRDGVLVTAAPQILYLRDTDNDGKADVKEVLFEGFNEGNQQLRMNGLRWGLDNWVYCANGGHHPNHGLGIKVVSKRNGKTYEIGSRDFRFNPDTGDLELESGPSQFGRNRDVWGHWFGVQNANPLWHYVLPDRYLARNPYVPTTTPIQHVVGPSSPPVYPASPPEKRFHSFEQSGRFTSACGGMMVGDPSLFGNSPLLNAFTCEPFHNLVQHNLVMDAGVSFESKHPDNEGRFDFFASEDRWCRPVMVRVGPDRALWVADMYRYMIEHPDWLPAEGKAELLPHYRLGDDRGRIYRVAKTENINGKFPREIFSEPSNVPRLVDALDSPNEWVRDRAHQTLYWSQDKSAIPLLEKKFVNAVLPETRAQVLFVLDGLKGLKPNTLTKAMKDVHPRVREVAVRLAEKQTDASVVEAAAKLARDDDPKVALQLALSLGEWSGEAAGKALVELATRWGEDPFMNSAIMSSALKHEEVFVRGLAANGPKGFASFREPLLRQSIGRGNRATIGLLLASVLRADEKDRIGEAEEFLAAVQSVGADLEKLASEDTQSALKPQVEELSKLVETARQIADDESRTTEQRIAGARLVARSTTHRAEGVERLSEWLRPKVEPAVQSNVMAAIAGSGHERVPNLLAAAWPELSPDLQSQAIDAWLSREPWTNDLLDRIEKKEIGLGSLALTQRARLTQHPNPSVAERAKKSLEQPGSSTRKQVLEQYRKSLELPGDAAKGKLVYGKSCANCHRRGEEGHEVGPNLATVIEHSLEKLLTNILDPNIDIQPGYQAYNCVLDNGEVLTGLLTAETANSVTIKQANGVSKSISRREIERLQSTNRSFMPEGLETTIGPQEMADLLAFLKSR